MSYSVKFFSVIVKAVHLIYTGLGSFKFVIDSSIYMSFKKSEIETLLWLNTFGTKISYPNMNVTIPVTETDYIKIGSI